MYGTNIANTLSLSKVLGGVSKFLSIANQAIPLYKEVKPMIGNARKALELVREFSNNSNKTTTNSKKTIDVSSHEKIANNYLQSSPQFFL